jgi:hypothetical protein
VCPTASRREEEYVERNMAPLKQHLCFTDPAASTETELFHQAAIIFTQPVWMA